MPDKQHQELTFSVRLPADTGSAAEYADARQARYPRVHAVANGKMSAFQRAQMYSLQDPNICNIAINGMFDDAQDMVKAVSNDHAFKAQYKIGTVNSINWGRVSAQIVYYFKGYFAATNPTMNRSRSRCLPATSATSARAYRAHDGPADRSADPGDQRERRAGRIFRTGLYVRAARITPTRPAARPWTSPGQQFERFMYDLVGRDGAKVREFWSNVDAGVHSTSSTRRTGIPY